MSFGDLFTIAFGIVMTVTMWKWSFETSRKARTRQDGKLRRLMIIEGVMGTLCLMFLVLYVILLFV